MVPYIIRRVGQGVLTVVAMTVVVFVAVYVIGDPATVLIDPKASDEQIRITRQLFGLDQPIYLQYLRFLGNLLQGEMGDSWLFKTPIAPLLLHRFVATVELTVISMVLAVFIGIPLGLLAGLFPRAPGSRVIMAGSVVGFSVPNFWLSLMLILVFAVHLNILPATGRGSITDFAGLRLSLWSWDGMSHAVMPAFTLSLWPMALLIRVVRAGVQEVRLQDFVLFARAKGLPERRILFVHILKNISLQVITIIGLSFGDMLAGAIAVESVFAWPGMGKLIIDSIETLDRPVIMAFLIFVTLVYVTINLVVDLMYTLLDPRVRLQKAVA
jgi:peptide/nickel transport system permease protein